MAEATNRFDLSEVLNEMKDFVRARTGAAMQHVQPKPSAEQLEHAVLSVSVVPLVHALGIGRLNR